MQWRFGPFRLDTVNARLLQNDQPVEVRPKSFDVLVYLVARAGELVSNDDLLDALWAESAVGDSVIKVSISELRKVLGESGRSPQYIATVPRRGYRFIAPVLPNEARLPSPASEPLPRDTSSAPVALEGQPLPPLLPQMVERETELKALNQCFSRAMTGERQIVFVTGEAGIGKTTLADAFTAQVTAATSVAWGRGQCVDQFGAGEAYLPHFNIGYWWRQNATSPVPLERNAD